MDKKSRNASIDTFKALALFGLIVAHSNWGNLAEHAGGIWWVVYVLEKQTDAVGISLFAITVGYFFGKKVRAEANPQRVLSVYVKRILTVFIFWSIVYIILGPSIRDLVSIKWFSMVAQELSRFVSDPLNLLFGGKFHLWFFSSMFLGVGIVGLLASRGQEAILFLLSLMMYLCYLLTGSYSFIPFHFGITVDVYKPITLVLSTTLFFSIGWFFSSEKARISLSRALLVTAIGFCLYVTEFYLLRKYLPGQINLLNRTELLGTVLLGAGSFMVLLAKTDIGQGSPLPFVGKYALGMYACHMIFMDLSAPLRGRFDSVPVEIACAILVYALALALTVACSKNRFLKRVFI